jgi:hypothetical protein
MSIAHINIVSPPIRRRVSYRHGDLLRRVAPLCMRTCRAPSRIGPSARTGSFGGVYRVSAQSLPPSEPTAGPLPSDYVCPNAAAAAAGHDCP